MKKFIIKIALFFSPIILFTCFSYILLLKAGELNTSNQLKDKSLQENSLIGIAYSDPVKQFKYQVIKELKPDIIALGTSRLLQIRSLYFKNTTTFYNAGRIVTRLNDIQAFIENYPTDPPKVIILGLDQNFFSAEWDQLNKKGFKQFTSLESTSSQWLNSSINFAEDFIAGKIDTALCSNTDPHKIGFTALKHNEGFRSDGSYMYGRLLLSQPEESPYLFKDTLSRINKKKRRFQPSAINTEAVVAFENLLKLCEIKKIKLHIFLPPYAHAIYEHLRNDLNSYPYIFELYDTLSPICKKFNYPLYDFSDLRKLNANDFETIDGFHGSETAYLKIILKMFSGDRHNSFGLDFNKAQAYLKNPYSARQLENEIIEPNRKKPLIK